MRSSNNELVVYRNENFTIDRLVQNNDGSPFIVGKLNNPYILITVSNSKFKTQNQYKVNYFLPLADVLPTFEFTNVIPLEQILNAEGERQYTSFPNAFPEGYYNGVNVAFEEGDAVFSLTDAEGRTEYKYRTDDEWIDYGFRFAFTFDSTETKNWIEQTYYYSMQLVSGTLSGDDYEPIKTFDYVVPLLAPTKISVLSNLEGGMK